MTDGHDPLPDLDALLAKASAGDRGAVEQVRSLLRDEMKRVARLQLARQPDVRLPDITVLDGALVDEAFARLFGDKPGKYQDAVHFMAAAAAEMRNILVDRRRRRSRG